MRNDSMTQKQKRMTESSSGEVEICYFFAAVEVEGNAKELVLVGITGTGTTGTGTSSDRTNGAI